MMQLLKDKEIPSYSYTPKEYKRQRIICRGLYFKSDLNEIKSEIDKMVPDTVDSVSKFTTEFSRKRGIDTGLFLVVLKPNRGAREIISLKYILNQVVSWERPKLSSKIPQCWRCQRWGHYSRNCSRPFSCLKCNEKHGPGECSFIPDENVLPYCVNCNKNGHTSNYRGCPVYKKFVSLRKQSIQQAKDRKIIAANNVAKAVNIENKSNICTNKSFADLFNEVPSHNKPQKPPLVLEFMKVAALLCDGYTLSLEDRIQQFLGTFRSLPKDQARKECLEIIKVIQDVYGP